MNTRKTFIETCSFRLFHLFPHSKKYRALSNSLKLSSPAFSSYLFSLRIREGRKALIVSNISYSFFLFLLAAFGDIYLRDNAVGKVELLVIALIYTLFLAVKFGFVMLRSFRELGEVLFAFLSFYFTHFFVLTLLMIILFENAEALSGKDRL